MNRSIYVAAVVGGLLVGGCSFRSQLSVETHLYGGDTAQLETRPDPLAMVRAVTDTVAEAREVDAGYRSVEVQMATLAQAGDTYVQEAQRVIAETSRLDAWQAAGIAYWQGVTNLVRELNALVPTAERPAADSGQLAAGVSAVLQKARTVFRTEDGRPADAITVSGIPVELFLNLKIREKAGLKGKAEETFDVIYIAVMADAAGDRDASRLRLIDLITSADPKAVPALHEALARTEPLTPVELVVTEIGNPLAAALAITRSTGAALADARREQGGLEALFAQVLTTSRNLTTVGLELAEAQARSDASGAPSDASTRSGAVRLLQALSEFSGAIESYASAVGYRLGEQAVDKKIQAWRDILVRDLPRSQLGVAQQGFSAQAKKRIASALAGPSGDPLKARLAGLLDELKEAVSTTLGGVGRLKSQSGRNLVAAMRLQPYSVTDPNLKLITSATNRTRWNAVPVNGLKALGDGNAQYIVVQDNLTTFRVKELSVDPSGVVNLNLDAGEMAVDLVGQLASAAAAAYGIPLGEVLAKGGEATPTSPESDAAAPTARVGAREAETIVTEETREMLRGLASRLREQLRSLEDALARSQGKPSDPVATRQLKSLLQNYERQLEAIGASIAAQRDPGTTGSKAAASTPSGGQ